jgi:hypothetical protein
MNPDPCGDVSDLIRCKPKDRQIVDSSFAVAKLWLPRARNAIEDYIKAPTNKRVQRAAVALRKHFAWKEEFKDSFSQYTPRLITSYIDILLSKIDEPHGAICLSSSVVPGVNPQEQRVIAATVSPANFGTNCFSFTPAFFEGARRNKTSGPKIIIHEMLHSWTALTSSKETYEGYEGYPGTARDAQSNPDSYAALIRELATKK